MKKNFFKLVHTTENGPLNKISNLDFSPTNWDE